MVELLVINVTYTYPHNKVSDIIGGGIKYHKPSNQGYQCVLPISQAF